LPGGERRSAKEVALFNITSFRRATGATVGGKPFGTVRCRKMVSANFPLNPRIIAKRIVP
jgi:hypothetical protein